jgi:3-hydroxy-5-phosphonooxypentane-2,4-dione thiolase
MGRNIFQSDAPIAMIKTVREVVHKNLKPADALKLYQKLKR